MDVCGFRWLYFGFRFVNKQLKLVLDGFMWF